MTSVTLTAPAPTYVSCSVRIRTHDYGSPAIATSPVTLAELASLRITAGFTTEVEGSLRLAGERLADQTAAIVGPLRSGIIAGIPHRARHSRGVDGQTQLQPRDGPHVHPRKGGGNNNND